MTRLIFSFLMLLALVPRQLKAGTVPMVGVLETPQCNEKDGVRVRVLFANNGKKWVSLDNDLAGQNFLKAKMEWKVIYEGKELDSIETTDPGFSSEYEWTYPRDRVLNLVPGQSVPQRKNEGQRFHGWCSTPEYRPLIVISHGSASDPSKWTTSTLSLKDKERVFSKFKKVAGRAFVCPKNPDTPVPYNYTLHSLEVLSCLKDKNGRQLVTIRLRPVKELKTCDGPLDAAWDQHTFLLAESATYLGPGLELVGAGDFGGKGQSELLFWHSGYNEDGYLLIPIGSKEKPKYYWGYH